ncbi:MAG: hypothetical protein IK126_07950 [Bacteroidales bacterium]|nr:hypothetical protein [Bacteroidales bacterium]
MNRNPHERPAAVYRTTVSILLYMVLYLAIIALFTSIIVLSDNLAAKLVSAALALVMILPIVHTLRHTKDRIVVTSSHLSLTNITTRSKQGEWKTVQKAILPWGDIKDISPNYDIKLTNHLTIQKQVTVTLRSGTQYFIDSDLYDVLFLEHKLKSHWRRFRNH